MDIKSSIVLITSAGTLLGSTLAEHFTQLGAKVILSDKEYQPLVDTYQRCRALSSDVRYFYSNDYSQQSIKQLFDYIATTFNQAPDVLINNWPNTPLPSLTDDQPNELFAHNLTVMASTLFAFGQMSAERMRIEGRKGVIINVISNEEKMENGFENTISLVSGFTQSWAKQLTPFNIRVGGVLPPVSGKDDDEALWSETLDELIRNTEYIVSNDYFSGRVMSA
jgi:NAD(P)-dependent dehydrogenase (short-subunit alcohol dehydrogenase family)